MVRIFIFYLGLILFSGKDPKRRLAGKHLSGKRSYRLPDKSSKDLLIVPKIAARLLRNRTYIDASQNIPNGNRTAAIFDGKKKNVLLRIEHIRENTKSIPSMFIARENLTYNFAISFSSISFLALTMLVVFPWSLFTSKRDRLALLVFETNEAYNLMRILKSNGIQQLYFYCPFSKDTNAQYLILQKAGIRVTKLPSPNLLVTHNSEMIADEISLGAPYQLEEMKYFSKSMFYEKINHWTPEQFHTYRDSLVPVASQNKVIGFYSHGSWLRQSVGHTEDPQGFYRCEEKALQLLCDLRPELFRDWDIIVFLHPREKKNEVINQSQQYYDTMFGVGNYRFADLTKPSSHQFHTARIGFGGVSTILFERLFSGYSTIFYTDGFKGFPIDNSPINNIAPSNKEKLLNCLKKAMSMTSGEYLDSMNCKQYTKDHWYTIDEL